MNKHHRTLELDRVLEMLAEQATCAASKELALRLEPCDNYRDAADALQRTADINTLTARYGTPGLGGIQDWHRRPAAGQAGFPAFRWGNTAGGAGAAYHPHHKEVAGTGRDPYRRR